SWDDELCDRAWEWHRRRVLQRGARRNLELPGGAELPVFALVRHAHGAGILPVNTSIRGRARNGAFGQFPPSTREPFPPTRWEFPQGTAWSGKHGVVAHSRRCAGKRRASA